jgi:hypothetical protein
MTTEDIQKQLLKPFDPFDIEWRVQRAGVANGKKWAMVLAYITNRAIMERFDEVMGIGGWQNEFQPLPDGGLVCGIKCKIDDEWITKYDGADKTNIEATKGGLSNSMKRAAVQWGVGRYLYRMETTFVNLMDGRGEAHHITTAVKINDQTQTVHFSRPNLPKFALPGVEE